MRIRDGIKQANTGLDAIKRAPILDYDTGLRCIRIQDISQNKEFDEWGFTETTQRDKEKFLLKKNDILIARTGATVGVSSHINNDIESVFNNGTVRIKTNDKLDSKFLYYIFQTKEFLQYIDNISCVATQPNLRIEGLLRYTIPDIEITVQRNIVKKLSVYDNLIENNNKRIKILEQMSENLYKEWFVRFRFPGYENTDFVYGIPKGWKYKKLNEIFDVCYGKDHKNLEDGEVPVYGSGGIMRYCEKSLYEKESVLIPRKGTLNNIMYVNWSFWTVDTMFYTKLKFENMAKYMYYVMSNMNMESYNSGAALPSMTTDILSHLKVIVPEKKLLKQFDEFVAVIFKQKVILEKKNKALIKQRDLLLPRLMSGKLKVK